MCVCFGVFLCLVGVFSFVVVWLGLVLVFACFLVFGFLGGFVVVVVFGSLLFIFGGYFGFGGFLGFGVFLLVGFFNGTKQQHWKKGIKPRHALSARDS